MFEQFGASPTEKDLKRYKKSPNWKDGKFVNHISTGMGPKVSAIPNLMYEQYIKNNNQVPKKELFMQPFGLEKLNTSTMQGVWFGHSAVYLQIGGLNLLIDPMLGDNAAPISPFPLKRFTSDTLDIIEELPEIDVVLLSHDHYDHLDYASIMKLQHKTKKFIVALGVGRHLIKWGVQPKKITEMDWWDEYTMETLRFIFTPTRHFSGRGVMDRAKSLWGGWVIQSEVETIWFSGDGGYGKHFKEIGKRFGTIDFGFIECGQYSPYWKDIHLFPVQSVFAALEANVALAMPVHWGAFTISQHSWKDPVQRFIHSAKRYNLPYSVPTLGQVFDAKTAILDNWWDAY